MFDCSRIYMRVAAIAAVMQSAVFAQAEAMVAEESSPYLQWIFLFLSAALVIAVSVKNAKRTHKG